MIPYILKAGIILAGCLIFYKILLQKETFFRLNRWVLFICLLISFSLPLVQVPGQWSFRKPAIEYVPAPEGTGNIAPQKTVPVRVEASTKPVEKQGIGVQQVMTWVGWLYWFGVAVFGASFLFQIVTLLYRAYSRPAIRDGRLRIVELSGDKAPCSFGNIIFINPAKYEWETYQQILLHEKVHILQGHSFDIILSEMVLIFQWFNPFAWIYRKELEKNLEFLTDDQVLRYPEVEKHSYQLSLVKVSAPHFPLNLTTNYNQSLLKKRVAMMNAKKSNMQTAWKYLFLFPLFVLFVSLLNEPKAIAQNVTKNKEEKQKSRGDDYGMKTEGYWFATIKGTTVNMQFKDEEDDHSYNGTTFMLSELNDIPRDKTGIFRLKRDAGTMEFTGKFEGDQGMGRYKFNADKDYKATMEKDGIDISNDKDQMVFFMVNISHNYVRMLVENGYSHLKKDEIIPLAALKVDADFIKSMKEVGFKNLEVQQLIPLKAMEINPAYVREIRNAGFPDLTVEQVISFKAQKIDAKYIADIKNAGGLRRNNEHHDRDRSRDDDRPKRDVSAEDLISIKALDIDPAYIHSLEEVGYKNLSHDELVPMKAQGITAEYIRSLESAGFKNIKPEELIAIKAQNITPEYVKSFESVGFKHISLEDAVPLKAMNVTPEFVKSFQSIGYSDLSAEKAISLKAQNITPELIKQYKSLGFENVSLDDIIAATATGTTPSFINSMREKGHKMRTLDKYIQLRNALED